MKSWGKSIKLAVGTLVLAVSVTPEAATLNSPVPPSAYITSNGLDWAWAYALPGADLSYQGALGWRIPTAAELQNAPSALEFLKAGGNVPFQGSDPVSGVYFTYQNSAYTNARSAGACAAAYFSTSDHCDWDNGRGQAPGYDWAGTPGAPGNADQLVVRTVASSTSVPALNPSTLALLAAGLGVAGIAAMRRRKAS